MKTSEQSFKSQTLLSAYSFPTTPEIQSSFRAKDWTFCLLSFVEKSREPDPFGISNIQLTGTAVFSDTTMLYGSRKG